MKANCNSSSTSFCLLLPIISLGTSGKSPATYSQAVEKMRMISHYLKSEQTHSFSLFEPFNTCSITMVPLLSHLGSLC